MRILFANTRHYIHGGDSSYTFGLAAALRESGHSVAFLAMADERNVPDENSDLFVSHIDFRALNAHKSLRSGFSVLRRCIFSKEAAAKCEALIRRFRPDVLHCQNIHAHLTPSVVLVARRFGIPVVWTMHDYKVMCPNSHFRLDTTGALCEACRPGRYWPAARTRCKKGSLLASTLAAVEAYGHWLRRVREKVDCFIAPSGFLADRLLAHGWPPERVRHVPNFIDPPAREPAAGDGRHFLFVGKLEPLKGIDTLLSGNGAAALNLTVTVFPLAAAAATFLAK